MARQFVSFFQVLEIAFSQLTMLYPYFVRFTVEF